MSRMDAQRQLLEHKKMYYLDSMTVDQRAGDRDRDLARRQLIAEAQDPRGSLTAKLRQSFGAALIAIGERIRPQSASNKPTFNA